MKFVFPHSTKETVTGLVKAGVVQPSHLTGKIMGMVAVAHVDRPLYRHYWLALPERSHLLRLDPDEVTSGAGTACEVGSAFDLGQQVRLAAGGPDLRVVEIQYRSAHGFSYVLEDENEHPESELEPA
jgi:hypothetical protein